MNIKEKREQLGLTQQEVAEKCGISLSSYQKYENGINKIENAKYSVVLALAGILGVYSQELLSDEYKYGDIEKRALESSIHSLLREATIPINTRAPRIEQKRHIAQRILKKLTGNGLGEMKTYEQLRKFDNSFVQCLIPITDFNIQIVIKINTEHIVVKAQYLEDEEIKYEMHLLSYSGSMADSIINSASDSQINQLTDFIIIKVIEYINYLNDEKKVNFDCIKNKEISLYKINGNRQITDKIDLSKK
jgi:Uncharacterized protein conserved in bacteria